MLTDQVNEACRWKHLHIFCFQANLCLGFGSPNSRCKFRFFKIQTHRKLKRMLFIRTKHNVQVFWLDNYTNNTQLLRPDTVGADLCCLISMSIAYYLCQLCLGILDLPVERCGHSLMLLGSTHTLTLFYLLYFCLLQHTHIYASTHTHTNPHTHACAHAHAHAHTHTHTHTHTLIHTHSCTHTHAHTHTHIYAWIHTHMHTSTCARTHTHTHTAVCSAIAVLLFGACFMTLNSGTKLTSFIWQ